jgi:hypothetical protein
MNPAGRVDSGHDDYVAVSVLSRDHSTSRLNSREKPGPARPEGIHVQSEIRRRPTASSAGASSPAGQVLAHSETYLSEQSAINAAQSVKDDAGASPTYDYAP